MEPTAHDVVDALYRSDWGRIVATLIRRYRDFDVAEEAAQEAFAAGLRDWPDKGVPQSPRAWVIQTARHKAIDRIRRRARLAEKLESLANSGLTAGFQEPDEDASEIPDDRLRLIFTCCHPSLAPEAQVALTLRMLGGLETDEIARAFLVPTPITDRAAAPARKPRLALAFRRSPLDNAGCGVECGWPGACNTPRQGVVEVRPVLEVPGLPTQRRRQPRRPCQP